MAQNPENKAAPGVRPDISYQVKSYRYLRMGIVGLLVALGAAACLMIWHGRLSAFDGHLRGSDSMGVVLAEQTGRYVQIVDLIVQEVRSKAAGLDLRTPEDFQRVMGTPAIQAFLVERVKNVPQANAVALVDANLVPGPDG